MNLYYINIGKLILVMNSTMSPIVWQLLLLAVTLLLTARADTVTWEQYKKNFEGLRTLGPLPDTAATVLALEFCDITEIKSGAFDGLPNLVQIRLYHNKIQHLDPGLFKNVNGLKTLALQHNALLEVPNFGENSLFPSMTKLKLNSNRISKLENPKTFSSLTSLEHLLLQNNHIEYLHPDIFQPLTNLVALILENNKIKYIPDKMFHIQPLQRILLAHNLISYVAPEAISSNELQQLYLNYNRLTYLPQHFVPKLKNASVSFKFIAVNDNPWQCACLHEIMTEANSTGVDFYIPVGFCKPFDADQLPCNRLSQEEALASLSEHVPN